jgi:hypothetical protein
MLKDDGCQILHIEIIKQDCIYIGLNMVTRVFTRKKPALVTREGFH